MAAGSEMINDMKSKHYKGIKAGIPALADEVTGITSGSSGC